MLSQIVREGHAQVLEGIIPFQLLSAFFRQFLCVVPQVELNNYGWTAPKFPNLLSVKNFLDDANHSGCPSKNYQARLICLLATSSSGSLSGSICRLHMGFLFEPQAVECTRCRFKPPGGHQ